MDFLVTTGAIILVALALFMAWALVSWVDYLVHPEHKRTIGKKMGARIDHFALTGERR